MTGLEYTIMVVLVHGIMVGAMAYGDYKEQGRWFWQSKKSDVNSGAKFG